MLKNLKRASAIMLSLAMAVQFGMADTYYANTLSEEPIIEETQEQEPVTVEEGSQQVAVEQTEAPAIDAKEEFVQVPETKSVTLSYVAEDGTILRDATTHEYEMGYSLNSDASVMLNFDGYTLKDVVMNDSQIVAAAQANLNVTSDLTSVKFVYQKVMTESHPEANEAQEENKTEEKTEEDAEADPEAKEELPEYPAFDMSATAGNVTVHVTAAEGVLPNGAQLIVKRVTRKAILNAVEETVTEKDKEVDSAIALDITIVNADGIEIQPNGIVNVSFENVAVGGEEVNVYHVTDDASTVTEVATNTQSFDANHFSIYVITGEKKVELTTFNFVVNEQNVSTQIVKTGDTLITPTAPDIAGKAFVEWQENGSKFDGFGVQTITKTEARTITAKYEDALYVYFYNPEGTQIMRTEKVADHKGHDYSHVSYDVDATHKIVGWAANQNGTDDITKNITVPEGSTSVNVYAIIKEGYWVTFDSDGGSAIDSQFVFDKISLNDQTTPTKPGYTFDGWYNGTEKVENDATISSPMTLTAHWKATEVNYTVNYWQQKVTDDKNATDAQKTYEYVSAETKKATTGTKISASNTKSYNGFTYNANNSSKDVEIAGDGTTIINVYYDRVLCTVNFYEVTSRGLTKVKTATGLYEASLPKDTWDTSTYAWYSSYSYSYGWGYSVDGSGCILLTSFDFKTAGYENNKENKKSNGIVTECNFYGTKARREYEVRYYNQQADGSYKLVQTVNTSGGTLTVHEKFIGYDLYKLVKGNVNGESSGYWDRNGSSVKDGDQYEYNRSGIINIASKLKTYSLSYYNYNKVTKTVSNIKYTTPMNSYENYTPERPSELPSYYVFGGWYKDKACTTKFDFSKETMPNANLQIYAKWSAEQISLTYNLNNPEGTVAKDTKKVEAGTVASTVLPSIPTINEYSFAGWYYADGNGNITSEVFNTNNTITRDTSIVGKWLYKGELRVVYNPGTEKDATVPTDDRVYAGGARVTVAGNATTTPTSNMKFLGWQLNGNVYKPGQSFEVNKDIANKDNQIILTATWGNAETSTTLTYDPGNGIGKVKTVNVMNNEAVKIKAHNSLGFTAPVEAGKEYYFAGWADSKTGNATYADGQTINIDANGENVLYAVWVEKTEITLVANSGTRTYNGAEQSIEGFESTTMNGYTVSGLTAVTKGKNVGEYTNTVFEGTAKVEKDGIYVTDKVVVKTRAGKLVITPKSINTQEITVTKPADSQYDGNEHKNKPTVKDGEKVLVEDTDYTLSYSEDVINVGTVTVTIVGKGNYSQETTVDYQITPRTVKLTSGSDSKTYDGTPLVKHDATVSEDGFVKDDGVTYEFTGSQTNVGTSDNTFTYTLKNGTLASNYIITTEVGKLTVNPVTDEVTVTIKEHSAEHVYDGIEKTVTGYDVKSISNKHYTKEDFTFTGKAEVKGTNVGEYPMNVQASDFTNNSHNFTNVTFIIEDGSLKITPKSIVPSETYGMEVTGPADTKYNGDEQKLTPVVKDQGKVLTENVDYKLSYTGDTTNVGTVKITIKGKGNYNGSTEVSYKITERSVTLTSATDSKVYDKTPLTNHNVTVGGDGFVKEEGATYNVTGSQTSVGESDNEFTYTLKSNTKAKNYNITTHNGKLKVTAEASEVTVVITGRNGTFPYDGTEKSVKGYDVSITQGSTYTEADFTFSGNDEVKGTEANTYPMGLKVSDFTNNNTNYSSVTFVVNDGSLVINPKSIIPDGPDTPDEKKTGIEVTDPEGSIYDGLPHVNPLTITDTKTKTDLEENKDYTLSYSKDVINVGTVEVNVKGIGNYTGEFTKTYKITPREYTVTTDSAKKVYDGTALTAGGKIEGIVDGEVVVVHTTGSQTEVGSTPNTYKLEWKKASSKNYKLKEDSIGTLTVTEQTIDPGKDPDNPNPNYSGVTINNPSNSVYDGKEHKWSPAVTDKEGNALVVGSDYEVAYSTSDFRNVTGTITVTITGIGNYTGTVTRTYEITPKAYTVTTESAKKVYDGTALTAGGKIEGIVPGETVEFTTTGSRTDEGTSKNTYSLKWNGSAIQTNYKLAKESIGDLTVTPKSIIPDEPDTPDDKKTGITVSNPKDSKYDGQEHREVLTVKDTKTGKDLIANKDYTVVYSDDLVNAGTVKVTVTGLGNYSGSFTKTYKITKRLVTLTSATVSKTYDGQALKNTSITVSGDGFVEGEGASYEVTGTQTSVGNSANAFEYKLNEKTLASNYDITKVVGTLTITAAPAPVTPPTSPTPVSPPPVTPRYIQQVVPALTPQEEVKKEKTPKAEPKEEKVEKVEKVEKEKTPKARPEKFWALINLICAIVTVLFGLLLLISKRHKNKDDEEEDDETKQQTNNDDESKEQEKKRGAFTRVLAVLIAILSVVFFLVTEDMSLRWTWTDQWTIWMVVIGLVQIVVFFVGRKWKNVDDDEDEQAQQA